MLNNYAILKNDYYEIYFPCKYEKDIKEILEYSTDKLIKNLNFFDKDSYGQIIKASFFDQKEEFFDRIHKLDKNANPPSWAKGCFYGGENQILLDDKNPKTRFFTLAHESCHLLFSKFIYNNYHDRIVWLDESFAANFSGEVEKELENGLFLEKVKKYLDYNLLPNMNEITFKNNNVKTDEYNGYDFFHIIGRYLYETYSGEELLSLYEDEEKVIELGNHILRDSILYFKDEFLL